MTHKYSLVYFAFAMLAAMHLCTASAASTPPDLIGVWHGSIGKQSIVACWDNNGGIYYPRNKPMVVSLSASDETRRVWLEYLRKQDPDEAETFWKLGKVANGEIAGARQIKGKTQAIHLNRVQTAIKGKESQEDCSFPASSTSARLYDAFNAPRLNATAIKSGESTTFMGKPYKAITALKGEVASVELLGEDSSIEAGNKILRKEFTDSIVASLTCRDQGLDAFSSQSTTHLRFWNADWLSWSSHGEGFCGGAHPFFGFNTKTIDVHTGQELNLWDWLRLVKKQGPESSQICEFLKSHCLPAKLDRLVKKTKVSRSTEIYCKGANFHDMVHGGYTIGINEHGIAFIPELAEPDRGMRECYAHYTIPFSDLQPYLSETGAAAIGRILNPETIGQNAREASSSESSAPRQE